MDQMLNVLILTRSVWDDTNSLGNTMSNFWSSYDSDRIANLYCRQALPNNKVCFNYFTISEKFIVLNLFNFKKKPGRHFRITRKYDNGINNNLTGNTDEQLYKYFRRNPSWMAIWAQEMIWKIGNWRNSNLSSFLKEFQPQIIFAPCFSNSYMHNVLWYIATKTKSKVVLFHADDYLSTRGLGGNLLDKFSRSIRSKYVKKSALKADLNYCISHKQQEEYERIIEKEMKLLYKGSDFSEQPPAPVKSHTDFIKIVYVGSTLYGRWKTLGILARTIKKINAIKPIFELQIYSQYKPSVESVKEMIIEGASKFLGKVPASDVPNIMKNADIVLHIESFDDIEKQKTRLSFSTKIVDCLASGRALMAIGWQEAASIDYLVKNDAALVAFDEKAIKEQLNKIAENPSLLETYARKAWECGKRNHQIDEIQKRLYNELAQLIQE